jgi:Fic family protein
MTTLELFSKQPDTLRTSTVWLLEQLAESKGRQALFTRQSPQMLKALREHALIESAVSSNRIEGVEIPQARLKAVLFGRPLLKDRNEEEVRGYRQALDWIHQRAAKIPINTATILELHRLSHAGAGDAGAFKARDVDVIERYPDGSQRVRFKTVSATRTPAAVESLMGQWERCLQERWVPPLVALGGFNLDFLCIHPFRDGNGRVSRLLLLLQCYHLGLEVGRYISLERLIEQNKARYYETLEESSRGWHEGKHDPWPYVNYLLFILAEAYREFEERVGQMKSPRGGKTQLIEAAVASQKGAFTVTNLERVCPGVSRDMIRRVLKDMQQEGRVKCLGRGPGAQWERKEGITPKRG